MNFSSAARLASMVTERNRGSTRRISAETFTDTETCRADTDTPTAGTNVPVKLACKPSVRHKREEINSSGFMTDGSLDSAERKRFLFLFVFQLNSK